VLADAERRQQHRSAVLPRFLEKRGILCFLLAAFVWFFVPETAKVSLETMDAVFGGANHVDGGAEIESKDPARHQSITMDLEGKVATQKRDV
jgi:hypothetical protein